MLGDSVASSLMTENLNGSERNDNLISIEKLQFVGGAKDYDSISSFACVSRFYEAKLDLPPKG